MSKLLDDIRSMMRVRHYSYETEKTYIYWIRQYIFFHKITHPKEMGALDVEAFLTYLAVEKTVSASTQNQALHALLFLYKEVLKTDLPWLNEFRTAKKSSRVLGSGRADQRRSQNYSRQVNQNELVNRQFALRFGFASDRGSAIARQRFGFRLSANHGA